jgi:8-oxo-dGTP diphosphatase
MLRRRRFDLFPVSVHTFFVRGESVLMMRRRGTGFCDGMRSVPAGHVMEAETILQAAAREAREEVGLEVSPSVLAVVGVMHRRSTEARIDFFVKAETWAGEPRNMEPGKCDEVAWFPKSCLPSDTIPYVRRALLNAERPPWFEEFIDMPAQQNEGAYAAFISHSGSMEIAERVSYHISRVGLSPWQFSKWSGLKVFFDRKQIRTGDPLPHSISDAIKNSQYFILLASRAAARSKWVSRELELWLQNRPATDVLILVLDGAIEWDHERNDFDREVTDCIPPILKGRYEEEVCWEDLKEVTPSARTRGDKKKLREAAASIGAKVKGVTKDDILRDWRRTQIQFSLFVGVLLLGLIGATAAAVYYRYTRETPADRAYNEGRQTRDKRGSSYDIKLSIKSFERALALNPRHVPALLALADAHTLLLGYGGSENPCEELEQAQQALNLAKQFGGDTTSEYHRVKGRLLLYKDRDVMGARAAFTEAVRIDPDNTDARFALAGTFTFAGQHQEAIEECKTALSIVLDKGYGEADNRYILAKGQMAWTYYYAKEYGLAIAESLSIVKMDTNPQANRFLAHSYLQTGNYQEAVKRYLKAGGDDLDREPNLYPSYTCARMRAGELSPADAKKEIAAIRGSVTYVSPYRLAQGYACIGETKEAVDELRRARDECDLFVVWSAVDPLLSSLREDAEFQAYLNTVGLGRAVIK